MTLNSSVALLLLSSMAHQKLPPENITEPYPQLVNNTFVLEIINDLHEMYNFKNFVFYITEQLDINMYQQFFEYFWLEFPAVPSIIISHENASETYGMDGFLSTPVLCFVFTTDVDDPIMELAAQSLRGVRMLKTIFILFPILEGAEFTANFESLTKFNSILEAMYRFIWQRQFLNTILLTIANNIYIHDPYPTPSIINKTAQWNVSEFFVAYKFDWKGYVVDTPVLYDLPRVFPLKVSEKYTGTGSEDWVSGTSALLFKAFIESINATFIDSTATTMSPKDFSFEYILNKVDDKSIEISLHSYTYMRERVAGASYPIGINDWCIMVPFQNRSPDHLYLQRTFENSTWYLVIFSCFYITATLWFCSQPCSRDLSSSFLQSICTVICIAPLSVLKARTKRMRCLFVLLFVLGFVTSNMFMSKIASYLTSSPQDVQLNTIDDIMAANLKIMVLEFEYQFLMDLPHFTPRFQDNVLIVDKYTLNTHRDQLNTSYGYSVTTDRWQFLNRQQRYLKKPYFRLSQICLGPYYHAFPTQRDSHFKSILQYFIMMSYQSGFLQAWEERTFADALRLNYVRMLKVDVEPMPLPLRYFHSMLFVWWLGLVLSGLVFIFEMKWLFVMGLYGEIVDFWK